MNKDKTNNQPISAPTESTNVPVELKIDEFLYEAVDSSTFINTSEWAKYFNEAPVDPYIKRATGINLWPGFELNTAQHRLSKKLINT
ncbi:hypothetical protein [Flavisolibacter ginsenosidimutans]|uniref:Uncharacterized protein n=1 Tax=Flavisolibacter ginsenosidimutans TaxID=661481 RepID=A0A5B8UFX6_9BACT|nr:hypothetical protein [Flavisolibacter ginsenosidimutans]QEC55332.1 hypothetical protein FSB75_05230 [Flavisolibacter ginsenosidimutans]